MLWRAAFAAALIAAQADGAQIDIAGPAGSGSFGAAVVVLANGNFVVHDPDYALPGAPRVGAIYLYRPDGTLVSTLLGSAEHGPIGGAVALPDGNFVVATPDWTDFPNCCVGAVTWVSGTAGLSGVQTAENSLIGAHSVDEVGVEIVPLPSGNYVVVSPEWNNGGAHAAGAVTWVRGGQSTSGVVSADNSLVGSRFEDWVGFQGVRVLANGNYVVDSSYWDNGEIPNAGAITWADGSVGVAGSVSASNSLVGSAPNEHVGSIRRLRSGDFLAMDSGWNNATGAVAWINGTTGMTGFIDPADALIGAHPGDAVGSGYAAELSNGNLVIVSPYWQNAAGARVGAVTWVDGTAGTSGTVSAENSMIGAADGDAVGGGGVTPLSNGNYVISSPYWHNGPKAEAGAATWVDGRVAAAGIVSSANSLFGTTAGDLVGSNDVVALTNGNYVVVSSLWNHGHAAHAGAVTWANGSAPMIGPVSPGNSLVGTSTEDDVGYGNVVALANGNYVVQSSFWDNGAVANAGAVTWADGTTGVRGAVSPANSLVGTSPGDLVGGFGEVTALRDGNYVIGSRYWNDAGTSQVGASTWVNGNAGLVGTISNSNSLIGTMPGDQVGGALEVSDDLYVIFSLQWASAALAQAGAVTLASAKHSIHGVIKPWNSVIGGAAGGGPRMTVAFDKSRRRLIVGRPAENVVSLLTFDEVFVGDFEQ